MDAYEISRERIEGMEPVAEGYKAIMWDSGTQHWKYVCMPQVKDKTKKEAWSDMPKEMLEYIARLPEFNAEVFEKITGIKVGEE